MKKITKRRENTSDNGVKVLHFCTCFAVLLVCGCSSLRFAPTEAQKQNAWLHNRTTTVAAEVASAEDSSEKLQALARLSHLQSRDFTSYYGLPKKIPKVLSYFRN